MDADLEVAAIAARQFGAIHVEQARRAGMSLKMIRRRMEQERLIELYPRVLRPAGAPVSPNTRRMGATLWGGRGTVISHRSAAVLLGMRSVSEAEVEITTTRKHKLHGVIVHHDRDLPSIPEARRGPLPLTRIPRTMLDLCAVLPEAAAAKALDETLRERKTNLVHLRRFLEAEGRRGRAGVRLLRALVEEREGMVMTDSDAEDLFRAIARRERWTPVHHHNVWDGDRFIAELDFAFIPEMLDVETDGLGAHSGSEAHERDRWRDAELKSLGWEVIRFSWRQLKHEAEWVARRVEAMLQRRRAMLGVTSPLPSQLAPRCALDGHFGGQVR